MRCPDCNKFVSLETGEPEEQSLEIKHEEKDTFRITGEYRVCRTCCECSQELKEATFYFDFKTEIEGVKDEERDELSVEGDVQVNESGGGRYAKNLFSLSGSFRIATTEREVGTAEDKTEELAASAFDELV